jgi:signal peptidase I
MDKNSFTYKVWDLLKTIVIAGFIAFFCIRGFMFEPFKIPSGSMMPTLLVGDFLFVSKYAYGNRMPLTDWFFWSREPERGDIVVFKREGSGLPGSFFGLGDTLFIKRLVAVPGDTLSYNGAAKQLMINGQAISQTVVSGYAEHGLYEGRNVDLKTEDLAGVRHSILLDPQVEGIDVAPMTVPAGQYVVMGDNRDNSRDSRYWQTPAWGFVPKADIMGRAEFIVLSWAPDWQLRLERIFQNLRVTHEPTSAR